MATYGDLLKIIEDTLVENDMTETICTHMDECRKEYTNAIFGLFLEASKGIGLVCKGIEMLAFTQVGTLLRQLYEQMATAVVLLNHPETRKMFNDLSKIKMELLRENKKENEESKLLYNQKKESIDSKTRNYRDFLEYGWLLEIEGCNSLGSKELLKQANMADLICWKEFFNNFVHSKIVAIQMTGQGMEFYTNEFIYHTAIIFDQYMCAYHRATGYDFCISGRNVRSNFEKCFKEITNQRNFQQ